MAEPTNNNLQLWDSVSVTDMAFTKEVKLGSRKYTNIDAYYTIKVATSKRWPYGSTWGFSDLDITIDNGLCVLKATFFYPASYQTVKDNPVCTGDDKDVFRTIRRASFPIYNSMDALEDVKESYKDDKGKWQKRSTGEKRVVSDLYKKIQTNTLSKALSYLWFSADIYLGATDKPPAGDQSTQASTGTPVTDRFFSHYSNKEISRKVAQYSRKYFNAYLTVEEQDIASEHCSGLKGKQLLEAMKILADNPPT